MFNEDLKLPKGCLISEFTWAQISKKKVPNQPPEHLLYKWIVLRGVIWHLILENLSQNENLSEIKLPLVVAIHAEKIRDLI